ncbi:hypothetical protein NECAME_15621 [Necator americanus]|uniref:Uncharacterized protein n=1 Tax=Necator americanus TaxID=51031 RepID=W2SGP4_NECAM|nr:hypothetical protein NECAME_15621 [Necator americanus]ETN68789.1 hypothetical protein NECAME_15621 [Necator americanus]
MEKRKSAAQNFKQFQSIYYFSFKNGSLTRERIRKQLGCQWNEYRTILSKTDTGNNGNIGLYFDEDEIAPRIKKGDFRFTKKEKYFSVKDFTPEVEARALLEGQSLLKLLYARTMGCITGKGKLISCIPLSTPDSDIKKF